MLSITPGKAYAGQRAARLPPGRPAAASATGHGEFPPPHPLPRPGPPRLPAPLSAPAGLPPPASRSLKGQAALPSVGAAALPALPL